MFTGIIEHQGVIESLERTGASGRIRVRVPELAPTLEISTSIAVNGCCLTVVQRDAETFSADLSPETLRRTTFAEVKSGTHVNLEKPLTAGQELGGHIVQGHVDAIGRITKWVSENAAANSTREENNWWLAVSVPAEIAAYVTEKGSLTVDGISLTVASLSGGIAGFAIIPYTYAHTNLRNAKIGGAVNLEADIFAKYVERVLDARLTPGSPRPSFAELLKEGL
ncbi:MAG TPA: riboflavin synthase [Candidatus Acidoferrales bacterium]|jgi:riboflavin synthase